MAQWLRIWQVAGACKNRIAVTASTLQSKPNWAMRVALLVAAMVIMLPIVLLTMLALMLGIIVFGVLAGASVIVTRLRGLMPRADGRENVRVVRRAEHS